MGLPDRGVVVVRDEMLLWRLRRFGNHTPGGRQASIQEDDGQIENQNNYREGITIVLSCHVGRV